MKISKTLSRYLAYSYLKNMLFITAAMLAVLYLFDVVELVRRASHSENVSLGTVFQMAFLKLPKEGQVLLPFAVLYSAIFTFWQMTRRYELIVMRSAGFSFWQFLAPITLVALGIGFTHMAVINPVSALLVSRYESMEKTVLDKKENQIAIFKEGLWLRQPTAEGYVILHAAKVKQPGWTLQNPMVLFFSNEDQFLQRLDAEGAQLESDRWIFSDANILKADGSVHNDIYFLPTTLTRGDVEKTFSDPSTMSFWRLPAHIQTLEQTGFDPSRLKVHYQNLMAQPLLFAAMILLAASVAMRPPRAQGALTLIVIGIFVGFVIFFLSSFLQALGATQQIPVVLAAWSPALVCLLLGLGTMITLEDG